MATAQIIIRMKVVKAFDYTTAGREYDVTPGRTSKASVDFRRADGSGYGCYVPAWQFRQAVNDGWVEAA